MVRVVVLARVVAVLVSVGAVGGLGGCDLPPYLPEKLEPGDDSTVRCDVEPTLSSLRENYFALSCTQPACHDARNPENELDLASDGVHARLIDVLADDPVARDAGKRLVVPFEPDSSFLYQKVAGLQDREEGELMPDGTDEVIDPDCRVRQLRQWIADGALDN